MIRALYTLVALCGLMIVLAGCGRSFYGTTDSSPNMFNPAGTDQPKRIFTPGAEKLRMTTENESRQTVWVGYAERALDRKYCYQVNPDATVPYPRLLRSNTKLRATVYFFREGADGDLSSPEREVQLHFPLYEGQQTFTVTDLMLMNRNLMTGCFTNWFDETIRLSDEYRNQYGVLAPDADTGLVQVASGPIDLRVEFLTGPNAGEVLILPKNIDMERGDALYRDQSVDFNLQVYDPRDVRDPHKRRRL